MKKAQLDPIGSSSEPEILLVALVVEVPNWISAMSQAGVPGPLIGLSLVSLLVGVLLFSQNQNGVED